MKRVSVGFALCVLFLCTLARELPQNDQVVHGARIARSPRVVQIQSKSHVLTRDNSGKDDKGKDDKDKDCKCGGDDGGHSSVNHGGDANGDVNQTQHVGNVSAQNAPVKIGQEGNHGGNVNVSKDKDDKDKERSINARNSHGGNADGGVKQTQAVGTINVNHTDTNNGGKNSKSQSGGDSGVKIEQGGNKGGDASASKNKGDKDDKGKSTSASINQGGSANGNTQQKQVIGTVNVNHTDTNNGGGNSKSQNVEDSGVKIDQTANSGGDVNTKEQE